MLTMKNKTLISIVGATAIGKTTLSITLAQYFNAPIISSDSRQFYKEMKIGTAVPSDDELTAAKHYFIQNRSIHNDYNVGQFERDALKKLDELFKDHNIVIMVGGSGLYVDAILNGLDYFPDVDSKIRTQLNSELIENGLKPLQEKLKKMDVESYNSITIDNPKRVIRALEICIGTGRPYSYFKNKPKATRNFTPIKIGLNADRELMYERINMRVGIMLKNGLLDEVKSLHQYKELNALQTVGYRELFFYLDGNCDLEFAISEIKKNTRRFAKRQVTWFKRDSKITWFNFKTYHKNIINHIESLIKK